MGFIDMSVAQIEKALIRFVSQPENTAIVLKGDWGTGKTHFWNGVVKSNRSLFSKKKYSYVSLFGLNGLSELKRSIFENTVVSNKAGDLSSKESIFENLKKLDFSDAVTGFRKMFGFGKEAKIPFVGSFGGIIDSIQYALVEETIICIDDFERRGSGLSSRDVLGLVSNLVETKKCSVVLILNDGTLKKEDEFFSFSEKVFDYEVTFAPSVEESVNLVFGSAGGGRQTLADNSIRLGISNIRLLKKIELFASILDDVLKDSHPRVVMQAHSTLPLAVFAVYGGGKCKVDLDFVLGYQGSLVSYMPDSPTASVEELEIKKATREKSNYLEEYGFGSCDEFDALLVDLVKKGYADGDLLKGLVGGLERKIKHDDDVALLGKAWELLHASFSKNEPDVYAAFELAISKALQYFTVNDLDSVALVYYESGKKAYINDIIDEYFSSVFPGSGVRAKEEIFQWPRNSYVVSKLDKYFESLAIKGDLAALIRAMIEGGGFPDGDIRRGIAQKTDSEFYDYFAGLDSKEFTKYARSLLKCGEVQSSDVDVTSDYEAIFIKTYRALLELSKLSPLNEIRMSKFRSYEQTYNELIRKLEGSIEAKKS